MDTLRNLTYCQGGMGVAPFLELILAPVLSCPTGLPTGRKARPARWLHGSRPSVKRNRFLLGASCWSSIYAGFGNAAPEVALKHQVAWVDFTGRTARALFWQLEKQSAFGHDCPG